MDNLVSIIVNCYNGEQYLNECLDSIYNQDYSNWEIIFYDNCSTDNSAKIFTQYNDSRFKYFSSKKTIPLYHARAEAIKFCNGKYIAFLDVDDKWVYNKLSKQIPLFDNGNVGLVVGNFYYLNQRDENSNLNHCSLIFDILPKGNVISEMFKKYFIHMSSLIIRKSAYDSLTRGFDSRWTILGDFDLCVRLNLNWELDAIDDPITYYRYHTNNTGKTLGFKYVEEMGQLIQDYKNIDSITNLLEYKKYVQKYYWLRFISNISSKKKNSIIETLINVSYKNKFRVLTCFLIPNKIINYFLQKKISK
jgi:glycosyltransferase involved in cell wall biosynthesis